MTRVTDDKRFFLTWADARIPTLSVGPQERKGIGFRPLTLSITVSITPERKPTEFPRSGITILDDQSQMIGPAGGWTVARFVENEGYMLVELVA